MLSNLCGDLSAGRQFAGLRFFSFSRRRTNVYFFVNHPLPFSSSSTYYGPLLLPRSRMRPIKADAELDTDDSSLN
ncbi:hypothetical protein C8R48DRAFT_222852 [Suillus tomentosus]|nr:hypothetical protein C8R48DRAFT_222852 [Suillus tomentosus]